MKRQLLLGLLLLSSITMAYATQEAENPPVGAFFEKASHFLSKALGQEDPLSEGEVDFERFSIDIALIKELDSIDDQILLYSIFNHYYFEFLQNEHPSEALYQLRDEIQHLKAFIEENYIRQQIVLYTKEKQIKVVPKEIEEGLIKKFRAAFEHHYTSLLQVSSLDQLAALENMEARYLRVATNDEKREEVRLLFDWANAAFRKWLRRQQMKKQKPAWWQSRWVKGAGLVAAVAGVMWFIKQQGRGQRGGAYPDLSVAQQQQIVNTENNTISSLKTVFQVGPKGSNEDFTKLLQKLCKGTATQHDLTPLQKPTHKLWFEVARILRVAQKEMDVVYKKESSEHQPSSLESSGPGEGQPPSLDLMVNSLVNDHAAEVAKIKDQQQGHQEARQKLKEFLKREFAKINEAEEVALVRDGLFESSKYYSWIRQALREAYKDNAQKYFPYFFTKEDKALAHE